MIKNISQKFISPLFYCLFLAAAGITTSCEDEVVDRIVEIPGDTVTVLGFNHIVSFQVEEFSADTVLEAVSKDDSLIIYWPSFRPLPASIAPNIVVANGATITPVSGASVPFATGTAYTVTAEDQSERQYILKVVINQPRPVYGREGVTTFITIPNEKDNILFPFFGDYFVPGTSQTSLYFISWENQEETKLKTVSATATRIEVEIPGNLPKGYYRTKLVSGARTVSKQDSIWVKFPQPFIDWEFDDLVMSQGGTYEIPGEHLHDIEKIEIPVGDGSFVPLDIISFTPTSITIRIPGDLPTGFYEDEYFIHSPWANNGEITIDFLFFEIIAP